MSTRYSKRRGDGSIAYYDSEAEMYADNPAPGLFDFSYFWAAIGLFFFALVGIALIFGLHVLSDWPKWTRFGLMICIALAGAYIIGRIGQLLLGLFGIAFVLATLVAIGTLIWHFL